ncbi:DotD/TraH family lipoprotein [Ferrimonas marina]|nr:DotD/TraH family lipoprotein [Ferrimonas marina]
MVSGCAFSTASEQSHPQGDLVMPRSDALYELRSIAVEARDELRLLAKTRDALAMTELTEQQKAERMYQSMVVPPGFEKRVTFSFAGDGSKAAEAIALTAGYRFQATETKYQSDPFVNIRLANEPLNKALRELGLQTGGVVLIEVDQANRVLHYIYRGE